MREELTPAWPLDLRIFAVLAAGWAIGLAVRVFAPGTFDHYSVGPLEAMIIGMRFYGPAAQIVLLVEAVVFAAIAFGIGAQRPWGLVLAVIYMAQVVLSHLVFVITHLNDVGEVAHVRTAALEGPVAVLILLYLWIRMRELLFDER